MLVGGHARAVVRHAIAETRRRNAGVVDTEDLLAGLIASHDAVVREVWRELGIVAVPVRGAAPAPAHGASALREEPVPRRPTLLSAEARRVLGRAFLHARAHGARRLGAGHLLLAIAAESPDDPARRALSELGVDVDALARAACRRLTGNRRPCDGHPRDAAV